MAFSRNHALTMTAPDDPAFENNPSDWNAAHAITDAVSGGIPYFSSTTTEGTSALLAAGGLVVGGGAGTAPLTYANLTYSSANERLTIGTGATTSAGVIAGYSGTSQYSGIWHTNVSPSSANYGVRLYSDASGGSTSIGSNSTQTNTNSSVVISPANSSKMTFYGTAGYGPAITAGTATTDVQALSITQTWNAAGVAFTGWKFTITDTASAAGALAENILGGSSGTTVLRQTTKSGGLISGTPNGGTSGTWKFGIAASVSPTAPNRTIELDVGGTIYYLAAKTTND